MTATRTKKEPIDTPREPRIIFIWLANTALRNICAMCHAYYLMEKFSFTIMSGPFHQLDDSINPIFALA
jgi:hypothetical protein